MSRARSCPDCEAILPLGATTCPACGAELASAEPGPRHAESRTKRYVYGRRKSGPSVELLWLLLVVALGILLILGAHLLAYMRARKLVELPRRPAAVVFVAPSEPLPDLSAKPVSSGVIPRRPA